MAIEGKGPYETARILALEKIERPSYYLAQRGMGNHKSNYNSTEPYAWRGNTISDILSKPEYMGHTVNFRTYKESYKDKRSKTTPKEDLVRTAPPAQEQRKKQRKKAQKGSDNHEALYL